ncbi:hypothetical protein LP419_27055 [Massilia sp. H-1]|nr:hypothetical protein LP419_27055 [Massilia sp. H-1]
MSMFYLERQAEGIAFTLTDEAMFLNKEDQTIGDGPLYLSGVFFYAEGVDGYTGYKDALPGRIGFFDEARRNCTKAWCPLAPAIS